MHCENLICDFAVYIFMLSAIAEPSGPASGEARLSTGLTFSVVVLVVLLIIIIAVVIRRVRTTTLFVTLWLLEKLSKDN